MRNGARLHSRYIAVSGLKGAGRQFLPETEVTYTILHNQRLTTPYDSVLCSSPIIVIIIISDVFKASMSQ